MPQTYTLDTHSLSYLVAKKKKILRIKHMKITANHAHLMYGNDKNGYWGDAPSLLEHMDYCGVEKAVIFPPHAAEMEGDLRKANMWAIDQVKQHSDRFIPAGNLFPLHPDVLEVIQILHDEGITQAKIHPSIHVYDITDPAAARCYEKAEELGIALDFHTGIHGSRLSLVKPEKFDELAWKFPKLSMIFEHVGGRTYFEDFLGIIANHHGQRLFGGLTSVLNHEGMRMWYLGPDRILDAINCVGADRFIFGLDFPWNPKEKNKQAIDVLKSLDLSEGDKEKIFSGNLLSAREPACSAT
jgi:predicted TIM-barrel fold metal-dependent hydrolase